MSANDTLLVDFVAAFLPMHVDALRDAGGPSAADRAWCRECFQPRLSSNGEALLYRVASRRDRERRTDSASMMADLLRCLAILSFFPGGVPFGGQRWFGTPALAAEWAAVERAAQAASADGGA